MKLTAFRIQNFRSVLDSGWCDLSPDNITALIGQNEAGKTSVLEALDSFHSKELNPDYIRVNHPLPIVSCSFQIKVEKFHETFKDKKLPDNLLSTILIESDCRINLKVTWEKKEGINEAVFELEEQRVKEVFKEAAIAETVAAEEAATAAIEAAEAEAAELAAAAAAAADAAVAEATVAGATAAAVTAAGAAAAAATKKAAVEAAAEAALLKPAEEKEEVIPSITEDEFKITIAEHIPTFVLIEDFTSLLPDTIDIADLSAPTKKRRPEGFQAAINFTTIAGLDVNSLGSGDSRVDVNNIELANKKITKDFQKFWTQMIGHKSKLELEISLNNYPADADVAKAGLPYLAFWIREGSELLYPRQISKGARWFLSFYLQLQATSKTSENSDSGIHQLYLMDEPGGSLHARAQENVLKLLEDLNKKNKIQVIFTTHSPHLTEVKKIYRLLAVQRVDDDDDKSYTQILGVNKLSTATPDTLSPIYTVMGIDFSHQEVIKKRNNIILEELSAFHYLIAFWKLLDVDKDVQFIPSKGVSHAEELAYLFTGWSLDFVVVVDDESSGRTVYNNLKKTLYNDSDEKAKKHLIKIKNCKGIEDIFSKTDYKTHVLKDLSVEITTENSQYAKEAHRAKALDACQFRTEVEAERIKFSGLNKVTQTNISKLIDSITELLT